VRPWIHNQGLSYSLNETADELETINRLAPGCHGVEAYRAALRALVAECNAQLFQLVEESSIAFERGDRSPLEPDRMRAYCQRMKGHLAELRDDFIGDNVDSLMENIVADRIKAPVMMPQVH
jgi:hypothetical protein